MKFCSFLLTSLIFISGNLIAQNGGWWVPQTPQPGDSISIFFDPTQNNEPNPIPNNPANLTLHWGVNEIGTGNWQLPAATLWPPGTVQFGTEAVRSPMTNVSGTIWEIKIPTDSSIYSVHFVFNDGTPQTFGPHWAHNTGGGNWNIILNVVIPATYPYTFILDKRSYYNDFIDPITSAKVRGTWNNWGTSGEDTLLATDNPEVFGRRVELPSNTTLQYKFFLNGDRWIWDPDNPITNSGDHNNSMLFFYPDSHGYFYDIEPQQGEIFSTGSGINIQARIQPGITLTGIDETTIHVLLDGLPVTHNYDPLSGLISGTLNSVSDGNHLIQFEATDSLGLDLDTAVIHFGVFSSMPEGIFILDPVGDNTGTGSYQIPVFTPIESTELTEFSMRVNSSRDSLLFSITLADISDYSRISFYLMKDLTGFMVEAQDNVNMEIREWNGKGIYIALSDPNSPYFDPAYENRLIISRSPIQVGNSITLDPNALSQNTFEFYLSLSDLQQILGTFNTDWYVSVFTFLKDAVGTVNVTPDLGGDSTGWNPNVYDALFYDYVLDIPLQARLFSNFNNVHLAWQDAEGRGFLEFSPTDLDSNWVNLPPIVNISTRNANTVLSTKKVRGTVSDPSITQVIVSRNGIDSSLSVTNSEWEGEFSLTEGDNVFQARATNGGGTGYSGSMVVNRWVDHEPQPDVAFSFASNIITLDGTVSTDPDGDISTYYWEMDQNNPEPIIISDPNQPIISFPKPQTEGEYYFMLTLTDLQNHEAYKRSFIRITDSTVSIFQSDESADWLNETIVYEIFIRSFSSQQNFQGVIDKLDYLQWLGINCIWFMPIHESPDEHGYSVADYYSTESDFGTLADFEQLVQEAHNRGIRIIIDHVVSHSSLFHVFSQDNVTYKKDSQYWSYYEHRQIGNTNGLGYGAVGPFPHTWTYYSNWYYLPNLHLGKADSRKYFIDMAKWWVDSLHIDGYRCDVAWGPINRFYDYWEDWRKALKNIKPEALLLGELAANDHTYAFSNRFDAAYDWSLYHDGYNSIWSTLNISDLHNLITNYGFWWPNYKFNFRFMENHDETRYINNYGVDRTKLIAALHLTTPGLPLIYAGQEVGEMSQRGLIDWTDPNNLQSYYRSLIQARRRFPAFSRGDYKQIGLLFVEKVYGISRQFKDNILIGLFNFKDEAQSGRFTITASQYGLDPTGTYYLNDILSGEVIQTTGNNLGFQQIDLDPYQAKVYILADSILTDIYNPSSYSTKILTYRLDSNYPNPFNPTTTITFEIPKISKVKLVIYNILGQKVKTLNDEVMNPGSYQVEWNGKNQNGVPVASGIYILHFEAGDFVRNKRMILLK